MSRKEFANFMELIWNAKKSDEEIMRNLKTEFLGMKNNAGVTPLHAAAWEGRAGLASRFSDLGAAIDEGDHYQRTPLHEAACGNHLEVIKILVDRGARLDHRDCARRTPLDLARHYNKKEAVKYLEEMANRKGDIFYYAARDDLVNFQRLFTNQVHLFSVNEKTNLTLYECLRNSKSNSIINSIREREISANEMNRFRKLYKEGDAGFMRVLQTNPLAQFVLTREVLHFEDNICVDLANKMTALNFKYPLELAVSYGSRLVVADVQKYLVNEENNINLIFHHNEDTKERTKKELRNRKKYLKRKFKKKYSRLHVAVMDDCPDMVESLLNKGICNVNDGLRTVGPPIYQCIKLENQDCLEVLSKYKPDMEYIDKNNQSLLHLMIRNDMFIKCDDIMDCVTNYQHRDQMGLTPLHLAVIEGKEDIIKSIIQRDNSWNRELKINCQLRESEFLEIALSTINYDIPASIKNKLSAKENVVSLNLKVHNKIFECILSEMTELDTTKCDNEGNNILHLSAIKLVPNMCERVINISTNCLVKRNNKGNTPLMEVIEMAIRMNGNITDVLFNVVSCLLPNGDEVHFNSKYKDGKTVIQKAVEAKSEKLMLTLSKFKPFIKTFTKDDILCCIEYKFFKFIEENIERFLKSSTEEAITQDVFMKVIDVAPYQCIENIYIYSSDINKDLLVENMLYSIYQCKANMNLFHRIRKIDIHTPQLLKNGETILTFMIGQNDLKICEDILLMKHSDKLVNKKNSRGDLPIHLAIVKKQYELVTSLISLMENINDENVKGETCLYFLIKQLNEADEEDDKNSIFRIIKLVLRVGGNIYLRSRKLGKAPIEECDNVDWRYNLEKTSNQIRPQKPVQSGASAAQINKCSVCTTHQIDCILSCGHKYCLNCGFRVNRCPDCRHFPTLAKRMTFD